MKNISIRHPRVTDGAAIWQLVKDAGTLDQNSSYLYLLLCRDFDDCCAVAERDGQLQGFVTGFRSHANPEVWFLWQVGVASTARGQGLAKQLINYLLKIQVANGVRYLETTVTDSNQPSRALFNGIARRMGVEIEETPLFKSDMFPGSDHEAEPLLRIGPMEPKVVEKLL